MLAPPSAAYYGRAVTISSDFFAVGAPYRSVSAGDVFIYDLDGVYLDTIPNDGEENHQTFGARVAACDPYIVVSNTIIDSFAGAVYVYERNPSDDTWDFMADLGGLLTPGTLDASDSFGEALAISANYIAVGATGDDYRGNSAGAVYIFELVSEAWTYETTLYPPVSSTDARFGGNIALFEPSATELEVLIGASYFGNGIGTAIYSEYSDTGWSDLTHLIATPDLRTLWGGYGRHVALLEDQAIIAAPTAQDYVGHVALFGRPSADWVFNQHLIKDLPAGQEFGAGMTAFGNWLFVVNKNETPRAVYSYWIGPVGE